MRKIQLIKNTTEPKRRDSVRNVKIDELEETLRETHNFELYMFSADELKSLRIMINRELKRRGFK